MSFSRSIANIFHAENCRAPIIQTKNTGEDAVICRATSQLKLKMMWELAASGNAISNKLCLAQDIAVT